MVRYVCVLFISVLILGCGSQAAKTQPAEEVKPAPTQVAKPEPTGEAEPDPVQAVKMEPAEEIKPAPVQVTAEFSKAEGEDIPIISIPAPSSAITVDGELNEAAWNAAAMMELVAILGPTDEKLYKTLVKVLADKQNLYVAFVCSEDHMKELKTDYTDRDSEVWNDDEVEIFFYEGHEVAEDYHQILINAAGTVADGYGRDMEEWDCQDLKVATRKLDDRWVVELMMPWEGLAKRDPELQSKWRMNFTRTRPGKGGTFAEDQCWSPTLSSSNHVPERFGFVTIKALEASQQ